ncbi:MAG: A/G-specific adenine glycosylase [Chloroflexales bacterium]|nr:A/G-specific adenine glycosylase [Chloroflexales bacterium]
MSTPLDATALQERLLSWFAAGARDLPWRRTRDPYRILVSELMLQQTQVERVIPKYLAFLAAFPTLEDLASAPTAEVIRLWAGLGYNRRAVNLQRAARAVIEEHAGVFPREVAALRRLPGVGPYTAGAVACFAFEQDVAFIDTNIRRVLRRALAGPDQSEPAPSERELLDAGATLVPPGRGWAWNQAIMELGALVCTASAPACRRCPIRAACRAYAAWSAEDEALVLAMGEGGGPAPARAVKRVADRREEPYQGSRRWFRGRLVDALRAQPTGEARPLIELGPLVKAGFLEGDLPWLRDLAAGLARDGLVLLEGDTARLP